MCKLIMRGRVFIYLLVAFVIVGVGVQSTVWRMSCVRVYVCTCVRVYYVVYRMCAKHTYTVIISIFTQ